MRWFIVFLLFTNNLLGQFTYSGYLYNANGSGANNVAVKLYKRTASSSTKTGTLTKITTGVPSDRGRGTSVLFSTANSDEASVAITFPSGFSPSFAGTTYSSGHVNANSWFTFGTSSSSGYNGNATNPNQPTIHIGSVDNGSTDNNVSYVSTESYTDGTWGDVFRVRYEGNCKYNQTGINYVWDLYFIKSQPSVQLVVWRTFTADGSNQEVMGLSTGSAWMASSFITSGSFSSTTWKIETTLTTTTTSWALDATTNTNSSGYYSLSRTTNPSIEWYLEIPTLTMPALTTSDAQSPLPVALGLTPINSKKYYLCDVNNDSRINVADSYYIYGKIAGKFISWGGSQPNYRIFTPAQWSTINSGTSDLRISYPGVQTYTITSPVSGGTANFYIIRTGFSN